MKKLIYVCVKHSAYIFCFKLPFFRKISINFLIESNKVLHSRDEPKSIISDILFRILMKVWIEFVYLRESDPDKREKLKLLGQGGESGAKWAEYYMKATPPLEEAKNFKHCYQFISEIETLLSSDNVFSVVQIGSSSGKEISYFANLFPQMVFFGTDINESALDYAKEICQLENVHFELCSAKNILSVLEKCPNKNLILFSSQSLEYVQPEHLDEMFASISGVKNLTVVISESGDRGDISPDQIGGSRWWNEFLYTHDYKFYAEKNGIKTIKVNIMEPYDRLVDFSNRHSGSTASKDDDNSVNYFYMGVTS